MSALLLLLSVALVAAQTRLPPKLSPTFGNPTLPIKPVADPLPVSPTFGGSGDTRTLLPPTSLPQSFGFVTRLNVSVSPDVSSQAGFSPAFIGAVVQQVNYSAIIGPMFVTDAKVTARADVLTLIPSLKFEAGLFALGAPDAMEEPGSKPTHPGVDWDKPILADVSVALRRSIKIKAGAALQTSQAVLLSTRQTVEVEKDAALTSSLLALQGANHIKVREGALLRTGVITVRGIDDENKEEVAQLTDVNGDGLRTLQSSIAGSFAVLSKSKARNAATWGTGSVTAVWGWGSVTERVPNVEVAAKAILVFGPELPDADADAKDMAKNDAAPSKENSAVVLLRAHLNGNVVLNQYTEFARGSGFIGKGNLKLRPGFGVLFDMRGGNEQDQHDDKLMEEEMAEPRTAGPAVEITGALDFGVKPSTAKGEEEEEEAQPVVPPDLDANVVTFNLDDEEEQSSKQIVLTATGSARFEGAKLKLNGLKAGYQYKFVHGSRTGKFASVFGIRASGESDVGIKIVEGEVAAVGGKKRATDGSGIWVIQYTDSATIVGEGAAMNDEDLTEVAVSNESTEESETGDETNNNVSDESDDDNSAASSIAIAVVASIVALVSML